MANIRVAGGASFRSTSGRGKGPGDRDQRKRVPGGMGIRLSPASAISPNRLLGPVTVLKYAVRDLERWMQQLVDVGIGPWWVSRNQAPEAFIYRGSQSDARFTWGLTWSGDVLHELIQPVNDDPSPYSEFLDAGREGLHHGAFYPRDYEGAVEYLKGTGRKAILHGHSGDARFTYFEGIGSPPQPIELQYLPPDVVAQHKILMRESDEWDGTDPFRGPPRRWW